MGSLERTGRLAAAIGAAMLAAFLPRSAALADGPPRIEHVRLYTDGALLLCDVRASGLIGEREEGTVRSGLPAVVELFYHLRSKGYGEARGVRSWSLRYDVWEDEWSVSGPDTTVMLSSFEEMERMASRLERVSILPLSRIASGGEFTVRFRIAVNPLSGSEGGRIDSWIEESVGESGSWREQVLSVSDLIGHFFSGGEDAASTSGWYESEPVDPGRLPREGARRE